MSGTYEETTSKIASSLTASNALRFFNPQLNKSAVVRGVIWKICELNRHVGSINALKFFNPQLNKSAVVRGVIWKICELDPVVGSILNKKFRF